MAWRIVTQDRSAPRFKLDAENIPVPSCKCSRVLALDEHAAEAGNLARLSMRRSSDHHRRCKRQCDLGYCMIGQACPLLVPDAATIAAPLVSSVCRKRGP